MALKVAVADTITSWSRGCPPRRTAPTGVAVVIGAGITARTAGLLVTLPELLVTVTVKIAPFVPMVTGGVVYEEE
jgi:hypothetical protein